MPDMQKPICFTIAPIGAPGSDTRKRSDQVLQYVFEEALGERYHVTRADKISEPGIITSQIIRALQDSELVLADLTEHNANVFYELAVRHAVNKPVIHVIDSRWKIPFDVAPVRTIIFDHTDLGSVAEAKKQLKKLAAEIESGNWGETPIDIANITRPSNEDSQERILLKEAVHGIAGVRAHLEQMSAAITDLEIEVTYVKNVMIPAASLSPTWTGVGGMLSPFDGSAIPDADLMSVFHGKDGPIIRGRPVLTTWQEMLRNASENTKTLQEMLRNASENTKKATEDPSEQE